MYFGLITPEIWKMLRSSEMVKAEVLGRLDSCSARKEIVVLLTVTKDEKVSPTIGLQGNRIV